MEYALINHEVVKKNKAMKTAQKNAKKYYGKIRGKERKKIQRKVIKNKLNKVIELDDMQYLSLVEDDRLTESKKLPEELSPEMLINRIHESGLTGLSGGGFSTAEKISAFAKSQNQKYLIINAVECDPGLIHDAWILENRFEQVKYGVKILNNVFDFESIIIATKNPIHIEDTIMHKVQVPNSYPMGYEKYLIQTVLGIKVGENEFPSEQGILVLNIQTVLKIGELMDDGAKLQNRYLTVADLTQGKAVTVNAPIGIEAKEVIGKVFPDVTGRDLFIGYGAMSAHKADSVEQVKADTNFIGFGQIPDYEASSKCKKCGACAAKCPQGIKVNKIVQAIESGQTQDFQEFHPEKCIGCGTCTYMCHAGKNLGQVMRQVNGRV